MQNEILIHHSPDADDAFMFYGLAKGFVTSSNYTFLHELCDIETLNKRALQGELQCTAASVHALPFLLDKYAVLESGASMGESNYGPRLVALEKGKLSSGTTIALPGEYTSTALATKLFLKENGIDARLIYVDFNDVQSAVRDGRAEFGAIIHEGQLTAEREGFSIILDLGAWWWEKTTLPLPLGVNIIRRDLGDRAMRETALAIRKSIEYSLAHREDALAYALTYGRGLSRSDADTFVGMYVNKRTVDLGDEGKKSIELFLSMGARHGFIPEVRDLAFVPCA